MNEILIMILVLLAFFSLIQSRRLHSACKRLKRLEYICMCNSKKLRFYYNEDCAEMWIEATPHSGQKWLGSVNKIYGALASPTGWESRNSITISNTPIAVPELDEYRPGEWRN